MSGPIMVELKAWFEGQVAARTAEPNSNFGKAVDYMLRHWHGLTLFLREAGAPDSNAVERLLKKVVLLRKDRRLGGRPGSQRKGRGSKDEGHEIGHAIHHKLIGSIAFARLTPLDREAWVYVYMIDNFGSIMTQAEKNHAWLEVLSAVTE